MRACPQPLGPWPHFPQGPRRQPFTGLESWISALPGHQGVNQPTLLSPRGWGRVLTSQTHPPGQPWPGPKRGKPGGDEQWGGGHPRLTSGAEIPSSRASLTHPSSPALRAPTWLQLSSWGPSPLLPSLGLPSASAQCPLSAHPTNCSPSQCEGQALMSPPTLQMNGDTERKAAHPSSHSLRWQSRARRRLDCFEFML